MLKVAATRFNRRRVIVLMDFFLNFFLPRGSAVDVPKDDDILIKHSEQRTNHRSNELKLNLFSGTDKNFRKHVLNLPLQMERRGRQFWESKKDLIPREPAGGRKGCLRGENKIFVLEIQFFQEVSMKIFFLERFWLLMMI